MTNNNTQFRQGRLVAFGYPAIGNDNVITDEKVATEYRQALSDLGVDISLPKSLSSKTGGAEFAKRFRCHHTRKDLSPISMRNMTNTHHPHGLYAVLNLYKVKRFSTFCRLAGAGYWTLSRLNKTLSPKYQRLKAIWDKRNLPFELWLGRLRPLNPYLRGHLIDYLRKAFKPTDLKLCPPELYNDDCRELLAEITVVKGWVRQWLKYVQWYHTIALDPEVSVEAFFKAPVVTSSWKATREDPQLVRFGLMWKLYDEVAKRSLNYSPPALVRVGGLSSCEVSLVLSTFCMLLGLTGLEQGEEAFTLIVIVDFPEPSVIRLWASRIVKRKYDILVELRRKVDTAQKKSKRNRTSSCFF